MKLDLYKIYRVYSQRVRRNGMSDSFRSVIDLQIKTSMGYLISENITNNEMIAIAQQIEVMENQIHPQTKYAREILLAVKENNYSINVPHQIIHKRNEKESTVAWVYLATATSKKGQFKIGATTLPIQKREYLYYNKMGYKINIVWSKWVVKPWSMEKEIKTIFRTDLVSGCTSGDSNEWYYGEISDAIDIVTNLTKSTCDNP